MIRKYLPILRHDIRPSCADVIIITIASSARDVHHLTRVTAMNRLVEPVEVAQAIAWLLSPMASGITGIKLPVDAGSIVGTTGKAMVACK